VNVTGAATDSFAVVDRQDPPQKFAASIRAGIRF
jgi:hypothetical protein